MSKVQIENANKEYEKYHWGLAPDSLVVLDKRIIIPSTLVMLGVLRGVLYQTTKKGDNPNTVYLHTFKDPCPYLTADAKMRNLYMVGGSYKIEPRGIVD